MATQQEIEDKFWKALGSERTMMLGLDGVEDGHARPMTAQLDEEKQGPIWFFTSKEAEIVDSFAYDPKEREFPRKEEEDQNDLYGLRNCTSHRQRLRRYQAVKGVGAIALVTHAY